MGIFFDLPQQWPGRLAERLGRSSHLVTDGDAAELATFAQRIGLKPSWLQNAGTWREHYDLFGSRLQRAAAAGAVQVDRREFVRLLRVKRHREEGRVLVLVRALPIIEKVSPHGNEK